MKTLALHMLFMCAVAIPAQLFAQITIDTSDVRTSFAPGKTITQYVDSTTATLNVGTPGATTWNFSGLHQQAPTTLSSVRPDTTPFYSHFPGTTHALRTTQNTVISGYPVTVIVWQYLKLSGSLYNPGFEGAGSISIPPLPPIPGGIKTVNTNPDTTYALPSTLGTRWHSTFTATQTITLNGSLLQTTVTTHSASYYVDAYGTMTLPGSSNSFQALRIRKVDQITPQGGSTSTVLSYIFISKNGAIINVTANSLADTSGTINIAGNKITWNGPIPTDVRLDTPVPNEFALQQNYPNPFNPSTTITYQVAKSGNVSLKVYNLLGQEIATLLNEEKAPGTYRMEWRPEGVPSGVYFYRLESGAFSQTKRMVLLK